MSNLKKTAKSKFISKDLIDFVNNSKFLNTSPKNKKNIKRSGNIEKDFLKFSEMKPTSSKKMKNDDDDTCAEYRQKTLNTMNQQFEVRKIDDNLMKSLSDVITNFETDNDVVNKNSQEIERLTGCFIKCMQQTTIAHKDKLKAIEGIHASFKKECEAMNVEQKAEIKKIEDELEKDIQKLKQKLISETKRSEWENLQKSFFQAMQNGAEGLLLRGAMKPDDRPLWFDVYKAFPPTAEPKFARPKPETKPIKQILYKEDLIRAKFHGKSQGLSVNMLSVTGETQIKKLMEKYQQLQLEGVPEEDIIQKSVEAVGMERQTESSQTIPKNPESVSAKVLTEANLTNIFKE